MKRCSKCGGEKPATTEHFNQQHGRPWLRPDCKDCQGAYRRAYGLRRRAQLNEDAAAYREANRDELAEKSRNRYGNKTPAERKEANRAYALKHEYGLTVEQYDHMLAEQGGVCALCSRPPGVRLLAVDHDHDTGRVRGLLCVRCNTALGSLGDNEEGLLRAVAYLRGKHATGEWGQPGVLTMLVGGGSWRGLEVL